MDEKDSNKLELQMAEIVAFNTINELNNLGRPKKDESLVYLSYLFSYAVNRPYWLCDCKIELMKLYISKSCSSC